MVNHGFHKYIICREKMLYYLPFSPLFMTVQKVKAIMMKTRNSLFL